MLEQSFRSLPHAHKHWGELWDSVVSYNWKMSSIRVDQMHFLVLEYCADGYVFCHVAKGEKKRVSLNS